MLLLCEKWNLSNMQQSRILWILQDCSESLEQHTPTIKAEKKDE